MWLTFSSIILAFSFMFGTSIANMYQAVVFLFVVGAPISPAPNSLCALLPAVCPLRFLSPGGALQNCSVWSSLQNQGKEQLVLRGWLTRAACPCFKVHALRVLGLGFRV